MRTRCSTFCLTEILTSLLSRSLLPSMWVPTRRKHTGGGRRPKKSVYHRDHGLDKAMDLRKKPALILELKRIIQSRKEGVVLLRDLEKEVGFVRKWDFMAVIERNPSIFYVGGGGGGGGNRVVPPFVQLTEKAERVSREESEAKELMEPILVRNLRKLLMLSVDCRVPMESIEFLQCESGLPDDYKKVLIPKYPEYFTVKDFNGRAYLHLENWDSSLAVTAREEGLASDGIVASDGVGKNFRISKDGNFRGPQAFKMKFPAGFRPNASYLEQLEKWQKLEFPSPYLNARRFDIADTRARKRVVGVLHELLSLTMEKRMTSAQMEAFHSECFLAAKLLLCLIKQNGIFYITNKGARSTVFLKEAYDGSNLINKCPLLLFNDKFVELSGKRVINSCNEVMHSF